MSQERLDRGSRSAVTAVDFFADIVVPVRIHDDQEISLVLPREPQMSDKAVDRRIRRLVDRARLARQEAGRE